MKQKNPKQIKQIKKTPRPLHAYLSLCHPKSIPGTWQEVYSKRLYSLLSLQLTVFYSTVVEKMPTQQLGPGTASSLLLLEVDCLPI